MADSHPPRLLPSCLPAVGLICGSLLAAANVARAEDPIFGFAAGPDQTGVAEPWKLLGNPGSGEPEFRIHEDEEHGSVLELHALGDQSDGIYRPVEVDLTKTPHIHFAWKVRRHPDGQIGTAVDDAAVQIHLDFGRRGLRRQLLTYVYDPEARPGRVFDDSTVIAINRAIVLNSGSESLDQWLSHSRNVVNDYRACYGVEPPQLENISIFCDANDSDSEAHGFCTGITFTAAKQVRQNK